MAISVYQLKPAFIALLRPVARLLAAWGVTANHLTVTACVLSCVYGLALFLASGSAFLWFGLPVWLFLRMALNALDGILAREHNQKTRLGALLNEMGDVLSDAALFLPLTAISGVYGMNLTGDAFNGAVAAGVVTGIVSAFLIGRRRGR